MRIAVAALFALAAAAAPAQDDAEAKKKRIGELIQQMSKLQSEVEGLLRQLSGGDSGKQRAIMLEILEKYAPEMAAGMAAAEKASNERNAAASLKTLASAEADFRANDRDNNREQDFWVADVSGLYRIEADGAIKLIEMSIAGADARPCVPLDQAGAVGGTKLAILGPAAPKAGYRYAAVPKYKDEKGVAVAYDNGKGRCNAQFGFCAYPAEYGKTGKHTFIINENNTVLKKDTGGKPVDIFPGDRDLRADGWTRID